MKKFSLLLLFSFFFFCLFLPTIVFGQMGSTSEYLSEETMQEILIELKEQSIVLLEENERLEKENRKYRKKMLVSSEEISILSERLTGSDHVPIQHQELIKNFDLQKKALEKKIQILDRESRLEESTRNKIERSFSDFKKENEILKGKLDDLRKKKNQVVLDSKGEDSDKQFELARNRVKQLNEDLLESQKKKEEAQKKFDEAQEIFSLTAFVGESSKMGIKDLGILDQQGFSDKNEKVSFGSIQALKKDINNLHEQNLIMLNSLREKLLFLDIDIFVSTQVDDIDLISLKEQIKDHIDILRKKNLLLKERLKTMDLERQKEISRIQRDIVGLKMQIDQEQKESEVIIFDAQASLLSKGEEVKMKNVILKNKIDDINLKIKKNNKEKNMLQDLLRVNSSESLSETHSKISSPENVYKRFDGSTGSSFKTPIIIKE